MSSTNNNNDRKSKVSKPKHCSTKTGLKFPVRIAKKMLREGQYADRIAADAPVYLSAVLEYMAGEVLDTAGEIAKRSNKARITPTHINTAIRTDEELHKLLGDVTISGVSITPRFDDGQFLKGGGESSKGVGGSGS